MSIASWWPHLPPGLLTASGPWTLPSGRRIDVSGRGTEPGEEGAVYVELGEGLAALVVVDPDDEPLWARVSLHLRPSPATVGTWPWFCAASVLHNTDAAPPLMIIPAPAGRHGDCCPGVDEERSGLVAAVAVEAVEAFLDAVAALPRGEYRNLGDGLELWRGLLDEQSRALVELITDAALAEGSDQDPDGRQAVAVVDLGLPPGSRR